MFFPGRDSHEHHPGKQTAIRLGHPFRAQPGQLVTQAVRGGYQPDHVHPLADRSYPPQIACSSIQETHCPAKIAVAPVVEGNGQLQRPLVKIPDLSLAADPEIFQGFVAFEPIAPVELTERLEQLA